MIGNQVSRPHLHHSTRDRRTARGYRRTGWNLEALEERTLLTAAALASLPNISVPATLGYQVPLDGSASGATSQTYTVTSSNPDIKATVATGEFVTLNVSHTSSGTGDPAFSGAITFQLFGDLTPYTASEIEQFVTDGFYNGKIFHRVANGFPSASGYIVQGGSASGNGSGTSGQPGTPFPDEFNPQLAFTGTYQVAMANAGPDTNDTQFFFTTGSPGFLNFGYSIFAQVVSGQALVQDMTQVSLQSGTSTPVNPITIDSATLSTTNPDGVVHIDATNAVPGETATITVTATDPSTNTTAQQTFTVTATADPNAPERPYVQTIDPITNDVTAGLNLTIGSGQVAKFQIPGVAVTPGDPLTYEVGASYSPPTSPGTSPGTLNPIPTTTGTATVDANGVVTFTPAPGFSGNVNMLVGVRDNTIHDPAAVSASDPTNYEWHNLTITVNSSTTAMPLKPIALPIAQTVAAGSQTTIQLEADNTDPGSSLIYALASQPSHGEFAQFNANTGTFIYVPDPGFIGTDRFTYNVTALGVGPLGSEESLTGTITINVQSSFTIMGTNPANGSVVSSLPSGQIAITFSHPIAGLTSGGPALSAADPFGIYLLARGPDQAFSAPSGIDSGDLPLHVNTVYTANADGTSTITLTPLEPLSSDVYLVHVNLGAFTDTSGEPLYDPNNGYFTFLLRRPAPATSAALLVTGVTANGGATVVANNLIAQPDTLAIQFNKALFAGAAGGGNVQLLAAPNYTPVPSVATYNPTTNTIYLTPTATLTPGTTYIIAVSGAVSDDQGLGVAGQSLGTPFYDSFQVSNAAATGASPLMVADNAQGNLATQPVNGTLTHQLLGYAAVGFTEALSLSPTTFGRYSAMLDPRTVGSDGNTGLENVPVNAQVAFNPNTNQLIIVPTQMTSNGLYVLALANMQAANGDHLETPTGQQAGVNGPPVFATFYVQATGASPAVMVASSTTAAPAVVVAAGNTLGPSNTTPPVPTVVVPAFLPRRPAQAVVPTPAPGALKFWHRG